MGNYHAQFLGGLGAAMPPGYLVSADIWFYCKVSPPADTRDNDLLNPIYLFINIKYAIPPDLKLVCNP
jgi:hypothetical protein